MTLNKPADTNDRALDHGLAGTRADSDSVSLIVFTDQGAEFGAVVGADCSQVPVRQRSQAPHGKGCYKSFRGG